MSNSSDLLAKWSIRKAAEANPGRTSSLVVAGPPGTGKSAFAGSAAEVEGESPVLLVALLAREVESWKYQAYNVDYVLITDPDWNPTGGTVKRVKDAKGKMSAEFEAKPGTLLATGFKRFVDLMIALREDETYQTIIIDPGTELAEMCWHYALMPHNVPTPALLLEGSRFLPYETLDIHMTDALLKATSLALPDIAARPKNVIFTWHVRPAREEDVGGKTSADKTGEDKEYEGKILPQIRGQFRRKLMGYVSSYIYTYVRPLMDSTGLVSKGNEYLLQVVGDNERHVKLVGPPPSNKFIPNSFGEFKNLLKAQHGRVTTQTGKGTLAGLGSKK